MQVVPANTAAAGAAQDAAIAANTLLISNITGQYIGKSATFAGLPVTADATDGDWAKLTADEIGTGTALAPQYPKGVYVYDGSVYSFAFQMDGGDTLITPVTTVAAMVTPSTWYELTVTDAPAQPGTYWVSEDGDIFEAHGANNGTAAGVATLPS